MVLVFFAVFVGCIFSDPGGLGVPLWLVVVPETHDPPICHDDV